MNKLTKQQIYFRRRLLLCLSIVAFLAIIFLITNLVSGASDKSKGETNEITLSFQVEKLELEAGQNYMLLPKLSSSIEETPQLIYTSSNTSIVTVDNYGGITAISNGIASVTAVNADKSLQSVVEVTVKAAKTTTAPDTDFEGNSTSSATEKSADLDTVQEIELSTYSVKISVGDKKMPMVTMKPETAKNKGEIWSSSDESIAVVDKYGNITGIKPGNCTVTVKSSDNPSVLANVSVVVTEVSKTNGITYIDGILIVNKSYSLPSNYNPGKIEDEVQRAFLEMQKDALNDGIKLWIQSGFRSYSHQQSIYNNNVNSYGVEKTDTFSARPGHSEHQTGLAFDINIINDSFIGTPEAIWVAENCHKYGFIVRYPKGKESITGYKYEPWHLRYLGVDIATDVFASGLCLEEYLGIDSVYSN